jgi:hypothetical protein
VGRALCAELARVYVSAHLHLVSCHDCTPRCRPGAYPNDAQVVIYHGGKRTSDPAELAAADVVLTTYSIVESEFRKNCLPGKVACRYCNTKMYPDRLRLHLKCALSSLPLHAWSVPGGGSCLAADQLCSAWLCSKAFERAMNVLQVLLRAQCQEDGGAGEAGHPPPQDRPRRPGPLCSCHYECVGAPSCRWLI